MATTDRRETDSGIEIKPVYTDEDVADLELELPGEFPFTRGPYSDMYRGRPWTMRQYAGFGSAEETNERFTTLLGRGQTTFIRLPRAERPTALRRRRLDGSGAGPRRSPSTTGAHQAAR